MTSPLRGAQEHRRRRLRRRSSPVRAAQGTGPPLRPPGCCASRWRAAALRAALDPGDHCGPWGQEERQAQACPRAARGAQNPAVADVREHPNPQGTDELASGTHKEENLRYRSQTLESVKHHLKPNRQRSVGPRHESREPRADSLRAWRGGCRPGGHSAVVQSACTEYRRGGCAEEESWSDPCSLAMAGEAVLPGRHSRPGLGMARMWAQYWRRSCGSMG